MKGSEIKVWEEKRSEGKYIYILKDYALPTMLLIVFLFIAPIICDFFIYENYSLAKLNSLENVIILLISMFSGLLIGSAFGILSWHAKENQYRESNISQDTYINIFNL